MNENFKNPIWFVPTDKHRKDLADKHVDFRLTSSARIVAGIGKFVVRGDCVNQMAVDIEVKAGESESVLYRLPPSVVEKIQIHPERGMAQYRLDS